MKLFKIVFSFILSLGIYLPNTYVFAKTTNVMVNVPVLNVREGPGLSYNINGQVKHGEQYQIIEKKNDWVKIQMANGSDGWVASWFISEKEDVSNQTSSHSLVISTTNELRIRKGPDTSFQVIGQLNKNDTAIFLDRNENWTKIEYQNKVGWVSSDYLHTATSTPPQKNIKNSHKNGVAKVNQLNVRENPTLSSHILNRLQKGDPVAILQNQGNWLEIQYPNGVGWVYSKYIDMSDTANNNENQTENNDMQDTGVITATILNVRDKSSLNGKIISQVSKGQQVKVLKEENNWSNILLPNQKTGWVASWFIERTTANQENNSNDHVQEGSNTVKIMYDGTNIRKGPSTSDQVILRADEGDTFPILSTEGEWYRLQLSNNQIGYVAGWIVTSSGESSKIDHSGIEKYLKGKTIVLDPGHGGRDSGTIGINGTLEKDITLRTAKLTYDKLQAAGANVYLTRGSDFYISLGNRVSTSDYYNADAFVSIHCDSGNQQSVRGTSTYYYYSKNKQFAQNIQDELIKNTGFPDRQIRFGDYQVIRENHQPAILIELGFLSNQTDELSILTSAYQEEAANSIYYGLAQYFKE